MQASAVALVGYALWTILLALLIISRRSHLTLTGKRAANDFSPDGTGVEPIDERLARAHANCYENLPVFGALVLTALVTGHADITDPLACTVLGLRVAQSTVHMISKAVLPVLVRFGLVLGQWFIEAWWGWELLQILWPH